MKLATYMTNYQNINKRHEQITENQQQMKIA